VNNIYIIIIIVVLLIAWIIVGPNWLIFRAMKKVIKGLKKRNSYNQATASTAEEIGVKNEPMWSRMFKARDYRPQALIQLVQLDIVIQTPEGKYFINESKLQQSRLKDVK
jgi:hypothetical protein